jgi:branched-subunit amino acid transport protein AzlD
MIDNGYALSAIAAMAAVTFGLRALPFLAARWLQKSSRVRALGQFLPLAVMSLLLAHTVLANARDNPAGPWAELAGVGLTMGLQWRWRQALLSILAGTALYVVLRNHLW